MEQLNDPIERLRQKISEGLPVPEILCTPETEEQAEKPTNTAENNAIESPQTNPQVPEPTQNTPEAKPGPGAPRIIKTVEELQIAITKYLIDCLDPPLKKEKKLILDKKTQTPVMVERWNQKDKTIPTITGLANALGISRKRLWEYENIPEYRDTIKGAKSIIEESYERELTRTQGNVTGIIFNLKNNFGWKDVQTVDNRNLDVNKVLERIEDETRRRESEEIIDM